MICKFYCGITVVLFLPFKFSLQSLGIRRISCDINMNSERSEAIFTSGHNRYNSDKNACITEALCKCYMLSYHFLYSKLLYIPFNFSLPHKDMDRAAISMNKISTFRFRYFRWVMIEFPFSSEHIFLSSIACSTCVVVYVVYVYV